MMANPFPLVLDLPATLHMDGFAGRRTYSVTVIGETRTKYRFRANEPVPIGRGRWIWTGGEWLAPKTAITFQTPEVTDEQCGQRA